MMILVGIRDSNVKNGKVTNEKCPKCEAENALHFSIFKRYTHLTLIPLFPVGKYVNIQCNNCSQTFDYEDLSKNIQEQLRNQKLKSSIWMFTGSIILALFVIYTINNYIQKKDETSVLIKNPIINDVYNLKFSNGYYSSMRIDKVINDSVYTTHNDFNAYLPYEIDDIDKPENYSNRKVHYSKQDIIKLYEEDEIIEIKRLIKP
jgi:predicted nucleic-acid-binding Zn-ribbon protein